jgi:hypothetical protein
MEVTHSFETSVLTRSTRRHIPEDGILHSYRRENLNATVRQFTHVTTFPEDVSMFNFPRRCLHVHLSQTMSTSSTFPDDVSTMNFPRRSSCSTFPEGVYMFSFPRRCHHDQLSQTMSPCSTFPPFMRLIVSVLSVFIHRVCLLSNRIGHSEIRFHVETITIFSLLSKVKFLIRHMFILINAFMS